MTGYASHREEMKHSPGGTKSRNPFGQWGGGQSTPTDSVTAIFENSAHIYWRKMADSSLFARLAAHEHAAEAEDLLRVWASFNLDSPLPLFIFNPDLLINIHPSRKSLKSDLSILQPGTKILSGLS